MFNTKHYSQNLSAYMYSGKNYKKRNTNSNRFRKKTVLHLKHFSICSVLHYYIGFPIDD